MQLDDNYADHPRQLSWPPHCLTHYLTIDVLVSHLTRILF